MKVTTDRVRFSQEWIFGTPLLYDIPDKVLLSIVGRQNGYSLGRVPEQAKVNVHRADVLGLCKVLAMKIVIVVSHIYCQRKNIDWC